MGHSQFEGNLIIAKTYHQKASMASFQASAQWLARF